MAGVDLRMEFKYLKQVYYSFGCYYDRANASKFFEARNAVVIIEKNVCMAETKLPAKDTTPTPGI